MKHDKPDFATFQAMAEKGNLIPLYRQLLADHLTPVLAYRRLVAPDDRLATSFLLESVVGGEHAARYSFLGAQPMVEIIAYDHQVTRITPAGEETYTSENPLDEMRAFTQNWTLANLPELPDFTGGWVGHAGYDTVRYVEGEKLGTPPTDDRQLPDMHFSLYKQIIAFDHVSKTALAITHVLLDEYDSVREAYEAGIKELDDIVTRLSQTPEQPLLKSGAIDLKQAPTPPGAANMAMSDYEQMVLDAKKYIAAGDIFQVVLSQRFERITQADPFDIYRALRVVNPSPYMFYVQSRGCILVGASPEILCKVSNNVVTNRPLAGTRRRGRNAEEDAALAADLLRDPKERAEHIMLVDLGRNDVGVVAKVGTIALPSIMEIERYSHVMHISSTVIGELQDSKDCWDAMSAILPVGTVSGAPKVRAMQIIDELEPTRRGPYAGAVGCVDFAGNMDTAIALRTMVVIPDEAPGQWKVHLQAGAGIVADSVPSSEAQETVSKAAALAKAVDVAESAFSE